MEPYTKNKRLNIICGLIFFIVMGALALPAQCLSQDMGKQNVNQKLNITSDSMMADQNQRYVIFSDHVNAQYGATTINSDKLKVFYNNQAGEEKLNTGSVDKIVATGDVVIKYDGKTAQCERAVYLTASDSLVLTGKNVRLESENSYISGSKVTIYQNTGQIVVDGSDTNRVNAVFQPEEKKQVSD